MIKYRFKTRFDEFEQMNIHEAVIAINIMSISVTPTVSFCSSKPALSQSLSSRQPSRTFPS